jgi:hypothetical protein
VPDCAKKNFEVILFARLAIVFASLFIAKMR